MPYNPVLAIVIPVYNEEADLADLIYDWKKVFAATGVPYRIILIDDGSKDQSLALLQTMQAADPTLQIQTQPNAGHGPAILKGYRLALDAEWIFQIDSDHQLDTAAFATLWENREQFDLLLAQRLEKNATAGRNRISNISRLLVWLLYGSRVKDVNSPYRLMRADKMREALEKIPPNSFAPNLLLTAWFILKKSRIFTTVVEGRTQGHLRRSRLNRYIFRGALQSAFQTILFRLRP